MIMHGMKRTALRGIAATVLGVGAVAFVAPSVALAQEAQPQKVENEQVPQKVRNARQEAAPAGTDVDWYRTTRDGQTVYIARFKAAGDKRREMRIAEDGKVVQAPTDPTDLTPDRPAAAPAAGGLAAGGTEEERLLIESQRLAAEKERLERLREDEKQIQQVQGRRGRSQSPEVRARRERERERRLKNLEQREREIAERQQAVQKRLDTLASARRTEREKLSAAERERLTEQDRLILEKARARREQEQARLARELDLAGDRAEGSDSADVRYRGIPADDVPESVREKMAQYTRGKQDLRYRRELREDNISYSVHYVDPKDNKRYWVSINEDGTVNSPPRLSIYQPGTDNDVRLASDRDTGDREPGEEISHTKISREDVPRRALAALEKQITGARDLEFRREQRAGGRTTFAVHYVQPNGKRYYMSVNEDGSTFIEPRFSAFQPGEKSDRRD